VQRHRDQRPRRDRQLLALDRVLRRLLSEVDP
jgi:hypothetical protein